jgi:hypothetical protein
MNWLKRFFTKTEVKLFTFNMGTTKGADEHWEFIDWVNKSNTEVLNSFTTYHQGRNSHQPQYISYVVKIKK